MARRKTPSANERTRSQRAQALQRGFRALGLKPLNERLNVSPSQARRIAAGSSSTSKENKERIDRLWKTYGQRVQRLATASEVKGKPVRERVDKSGARRRFVGRYELPESPIVQAGAYRFPDDTDLQNLASNALADQLAGVEEWINLTVYVGGEAVGVAVEEIPHTAYSITAHYIAREYRRGAREIFDLRSIYRVGSPAFELASRGLRRNKNGGVRLRSLGDVRRFAEQFLAAEPIEIVSAFDGPDEVVSPSYLVIDEDLTDAIEGAL